MSRTWCLPSLIWKKQSKGLPPIGLLTLQVHLRKRLKVLPDLKGVTLADLEVREIEGGDYVVAVVRQKGRTTVDLLAEELPGLISKINFVKSMRWNTTNVAFSRPIRWLLALHGQRLFPLNLPAYELAI